ncbi:MAG: hypothetical protein OEU86_08770, partial [Gammaproteobacteria bacterium]|nr:hypothetical protein [Gammaproteobacteria bacterium]
ALLRWFRRRMIRREHEIYRLLNGIRGIPRCFGLEDDCLILEYIDSQPLKLSKNTLQEREHFFSSLLVLLQATHAAGVAHADLKRKENILVGPGEAPYLIDFGSAVICSHTSGAFRRWLFRQFCQIDLNAWCKHKYLGRYDEISAADLPLYRATFVERLIRPLRRAWRTVTARQWRKARKHRKKL